MSSQTVDRAGHAISEAQIDRVLADCVRLTRDSTAAQWADCSTRLGFRDLVRIHPADHFWPLQTWETVSFLVGSPASSPSSPTAGSATVPPDPRHSRRFARGNAEGRRRRTRSRREDWVQHRPDCSLGGSGLPGPGIDMS